MSSSPEFTVVPNIGYGSFPSGVANTSRDGVGATGRLLLWTCGAGGGRAEHAFFIPKGSTVTKTLIRLFLNNSSDPEVAGNNIFIGSRVIEIWTATESTEEPVYMLPIGLPVPPNWRIYGLIATSVSAQIAAAVVGGSFS